MKKTIIMGLVMATVGITIAAGLISSPTAVYAQGRTTTTVVSAPFEIDGQPLCGGENVQFSGTQNLILVTTQQPDGEYTTRLQHINYQQVMGTTTSGDKVIVAETDNYGRQISENQQMNVIHGTLVIQGQPTNTVFSETMHIITNANGQPVVNIDHIVVQCRG